LERGLLANAVMVAAVAMACVGLATCGGPEDAEPAGAPQGAGGTPAKAPQPTAAPAGPGANAPEDTPKAADELEKPPAAEATGEPLTAETLTGTVWLARGIYRVSLMPEGKAKLAASEGTWRVEGTSLILTRGDDEIVAEIRGDTLYYEDKPLRRVIEE
jgi:hypothetical protein